MFQKFLRIFTRYNIEIAAEFGAEQPDILLEIIFEQQQKGVI
jgi:hypothetical protein